MATIPSVLRNDVDGIAWLTLNRPHAMNALDRATIAELEHEITDVAADDDVRVIVVTGTGRAFSAGADLKDVLSGRSDLDEANTIVDFVASASRCIERVAVLPKPVIAAVNGIAMAGGLELALACDVIVAAEGATVGDGHATYGLLPGAGGSVRLLRRVGPGAAKRLMFTGEIVSAARALALGLVDEVIADEALLDHVGQLAAAIAAKSPGGMAAMKSLIDDAADRVLAESLMAELDALRSHAAGPDVLEGLTAFREKRAPRFAPRSGEVRA